MTFSEWLSDQAKINKEIGFHLSKTMNDDAWQHNSDNLKKIMLYLNGKEVSMEIIGHVLKYWTQYLKAVSRLRPVAANEIRDVREVLVHMLYWIRENADSSFEGQDLNAMREAESQVAQLEEKEIELRYYYYKKSC